MERKKRHHRRDEAAVLPLLCHRAGGVVVAPLGEPLLERGARVAGLACTGGAQGYIDKAHQLGVDAYLSGEISENTTHSARDNGIHYIAAGHHATERYGAKALGEHLAEQFGLEHVNIDIDNPA